jgi:predicted nucleic acid-binding protein
MQSLDAIHLATARRLGRDLGRVASYDERMIDAAAGLVIDREPDVTLSRCVKTV